MIPSTISALKWQWVVLSGSWYLLEESWVTIKQVGEACSSAAVSRIILSDLVSIPAIGNRVASNFWIAFVFVRRTATVLLFLALASFLWRRSRSYCNSLYRCSFHFLKQLLFWLGLCSRILGVRFRHNISNRISKKPINQVPNDDWAPMMYN